MTDTSAAAAKKRAEEQLTTAMAGMVTASNADTAAIEADDAEAKRQEKQRAQEHAAAKVGPRKIKSQKICELLAVPSVVEATAHSELLSAGL